MCAVIRDSGLTSNDPVLGNNQYNEYGFIDVIAIPREENNNLILRFYSYEKVNNHTLQYDGEDIKDYLFYKNMKYLGKRGINGSSINKFAAKLCSKERNGRIICFKINEKRIIYRLKGFVLHYCHQIENFNDTIKKNMIVDDAVIYNGNEYKVFENKFVSDFMGFPLNVWHDSDYVPEENYDILYKNEEYRRNSR